MIQIELGYEKGARKRSYANGKTPAEARANAVAIATKLARGEHAKTKKADTVTTFLDVRLERVAAQRKASTTEDHCR